MKIREKELERAKLEKKKKLKYEENVRNKKNDEILCEIRKCKAAIKKILKDKLKVYLTYNCEAGEMTGRELFYDLFSGKCEGRSQFVSFILMQPAQQSCQMFWCSCHRSLIGQYFGSPCSPYKVSKTAQTCKEMKAIYFCMYPRTLYEKFSKHSTPEACCCAEKWQGVESRRQRRQKL